MNVPLSILDLAPISAGSNAASALRNTVDLARHAEHWGYHRFWVAEHHFASVASSSPAVLIGQIAAFTDHIHIGSAAIQLGYTTAVAVVETFGMLDAFYPGRIVLGVGRSGHRVGEAQRPAQDKQAAAAEIPGQWREVDGVVIPPPVDRRSLLRSDRVRTTISLLQQPEAHSPDFAPQVREIQAMIAGDYQVDGVAVRTVPGERASLSPWIFGSSAGPSAQLAGELGLPFVASYHTTPSTALDGVEAYRNAFRPSAVLSEPYVVVSADVVVAGDSETARHLASSFGHWVYSIRSGAGAMPYPDPDDCAPLSDEQLAAVKDRTVTQFVGDPDEVADRLFALQRVTAADELMITSVTHQYEDRLRSHRLIAERWGCRDQDSRRSPVRQSTPNGHVVHGRP